MFCKPWGKGLSVPGGYCFAQRAKMFPILNEHTVIKNVEKRSYIKQKIPCLIFQGLEVNLRF